MHFQVGDFVEIDRVSDLGAGLQDIAGLFCVITEIPNLREPLRAEVYRIKPLCGYDIGRLAANNENGFLAIGSILIPEMQQKRLI